MKKSLIALLLLTALILSGCNTKDNQLANSEISSNESIIYDSETEEIEQDITEEETPEPIVEEFTVNIKMVGDNLIHGSVYKAALQENGEYNFDNLFMHVKEDIESADIAIINQETIFTYNKNEYSSYPTFGTPAEMGHAIVNAGFDVVAHATNHTLDKKVQGVLDTIDFWKTNYPDIKYLGIHDSEEDSDIRYIEKNNIKFAFVNYTYGLNGLDSWKKGNHYLVDMLEHSDIEETLAEAEQNAEMTVAILHAGNEYVYKPTDYVKQQVARFIDNGADIVLCAHPHVVQPYEIVTTASGKSALVYYSLGNFTSAQNKIPRVLGGMADITIKKVTVDGIVASLEIVDYNMIPLVTHQQYRYYTTYKLDEYPDELESKHSLRKEGFSKQALQELWNKIIKGVN